MTRPNLAYRILIRSVIYYAILCLVAGIMLANISVRLPKDPVDAADTAKIRARVQREFHATVDDVSLTGFDGAILKAWYIEPINPNGKAVLILHGIGGNRIDETGFGDIFLSHGYAVLLPDSREHGASGGPAATYGILERDDIRRWVDWVRQRDSGCTYLLGESMGAAIGLQATAVTPRLCAVAVESPYSTFREIGYERLGRESRFGPLFWRTLGRPIIEVAIAYTKLRDGIYLPNAEPKQAVQQSHVPALLIAGTVDKDIPMHHAQELQAVCPSHCALWIVPGADHGGAATVNQAEFAHRVLGWFQAHDTAIAGYRPAASISAK